MEADEVKRRLAEEQDRLLGIKTTFDQEGLTQLSEQERLVELSSVDQHQADTGTETHDRERDFSILEQVEAELADIEHALHRLDAGTYGSCEACGRPIGEARLEALPATRFCIDDQAVAEREARLSPTEQEG